MFKSNKANKKRIGLNALANRVSVVNGKIPLSWFNLTIDTYKIKCKMKFSSESLVHIPEIVENVLLLNGLLMCL